MKLTYETADQIIAFCEKLTCSVGPKAGQKFQLIDFQKKFIRETFAETENGKRPVLSAILTGPRKISKSTTCAMLVLAHLIGPVSEANGEIVLAANSREQASVLFDEIARMVRADPWLPQIVKVIPSTKRVIVRRSDVSYAGSVIRVISAEANTAHGLNPSLIIYDEIGQAKSRDLFEALTTSQAARENPLFISISTQNGDPNHFFSQMVETALEANDPALVCHKYAADDNCDILDENQWFKANPSLGNFVSVEYYRAKALEASRSPLGEQSFRKYFLNLKVSAHTGFLNPEDWRSAADPECDLFEGEDIVLALDMSAVADLTALTAVSLTDRARVKAWFWKPESRIQSDTKSDNFDYLTAVSNGHLTAPTGRVIKPEEVVAHIKSLAETYNVRALVFDDWGMASLEAELERAGFHVDRDNADNMKLISHRQGFKSMAPAITAFETEFLSNNLIHPNNPILNFCMLNAVATMDPAGNRKLDKSKSTHRIDGAVALVMCMGHRAEIREDYAPTNPFDDDEEFSLLSL